jgi:glycosyltransferase involved in cell wall biosynthesis
MTKHNRVFIVWKKYQRRVEVLAPLLNATIFYRFYDWESRSKFHKMISYIFKSLCTFKYLFENMPDLVFVQFPPAPAVYCVAIFSWLTRTRFVTDCHIGMTNEHWLKWIFIKRLLSKGMVIVHNEHLVDQVKTSIKTTPFVLRDGIEKNLSIDSGKKNLLNNLGLVPKKYVIIPFSFSPDEPIQEVVESARLLPGIKFVMTWDSDKLSYDMKNDFPPNILLTGYLPINDFNNLFANSGVALVLTTHEAVQLSGMQEAMAFEIPAVVSDLRTTRFLYKNYPVFVKNDSRSIAGGVTLAFQIGPELEGRMRNLRIESEKEFLMQVDQLKTTLKI